MHKIFVFFPLKVLSEINSLAGSHTGTNIAKGIKKHLLVHNSGTNYIKGYET